MWAAVSVIVLETVLLGIAVAPVVAFVQWQSTWVLADAVRIALLSLAVVPLYLLFALILIIVSPLATGLLGWRTPDNVTARLTDFEWPVLDWGRYLMTRHVVRVFAGPAFRSTPFWSLYLRLNGARIGTLVWVNGLAVMDHNLLELDDDVVIGSDVHLSAHTVEHGMLRTARVHLQRGTVIGVGSVLGIGVTTGVGTPVGALSVVPKFATLDDGAAYAGVPVRRLS